MNIKIKRLTIEMLESSYEILEWIEQFDYRNTLAAKLLLCRLQFICRDDFSKWLIDKLSSYIKAQPVAVYSVRKFRKNCKSLWQENGRVQPRPAQTQGSEDLVASVIVNANRMYNNVFIDHPSLNELKKQKVRNIILVDDSIGSGKRVLDFIKLMTNNKTFLSWWSGGYITIHIVSYARTIQSEKKILHDTPGSDHGIRKIRLSDKLKFDSNIIYDAYNLHRRWGNNSEQILTLCNSIRKIKKDRRKGFGNVMGNLIFYHSVPNNIPGLLFSTSKGWKPLFPNRNLPNWFINLIEGNYVSKKHNEKYKLQVKDEIVIILKNIKKGLRTKAALSRRMDSDIIIIERLINESIKSGFITRQIRLTKAGLNFLKAQKKGKYITEPNYSLYIPKSWCVDQGTVQPSVLDANGANLQTDSVDLLSIDGGDGKSSLERTDAKATSSPMRDVTKHPSWARDRYISHGPKG